MMTAFVQMILLAMAPGAYCEEPAENTPPVDEDRARALVEALLVQAQREEPETAWFASNFRDSRNEPSPEQAGALAQLLQNGLLGNTLRHTEIEIEPILGPDYLRFNLVTEPGLAVIVNTFDHDSPTIRDIVVRSCSDCSEPERFVRDLIWSVSRGEDSPILVPSLDLHLEPFLEANPGYSSHWVAMLQTRNQKSRLPHFLLRRATVVSSNEDRFQIRYSDGYVDNWHVLYHDGRWAIDYNSFNQDSPLRMGRDDMWRWRETSEMQKWALERWEPRWKTTPGDLGVEVGHHAIGMAFDPFDQTILVATTDIDRILSGYFRVDPYTLEVLERIPLSPPSTRTSLPIDQWYERWHFELSSDRRAAALALPSRLWLLDLESGRQQLLESLQEVDAVAIGDIENSDRYRVAAATRSSIAVYGMGESIYLPIPAPILTLAFHEDQLTAVTIEGEILEYSGPTFQLRSLGKACCDEEARDARINPSGDEVLLTCSSRCDRAWERFDVVGGSSIPLHGSPSSGPSLSWSPLGDRFQTTSSTGALLIWDSQSNAPIAELDAPNETIETLWSNDGTALISRDASGVVTWWSIPKVHNKKGLH